MFELNVNYEELEKILEEEAKKNTAEEKKLALIRNGIVLSFFDMDAYITDIEAKACEIGRKTLRCEDIDLYYVTIEENNITKKRMIQRDLLKEEFEHYQIIDGHIYELEDEELEDEIMKYARDIFSNILYRSDAYFEICYNIQTYDKCVYNIFEQIEKMYNKGCTIYTTENSFLLYGTYAEAMTTNFKNYKIILNKKTKKLIIKEVKRSGLSEAAKKEIISRVKTY